MKTIWCMYIYIYKYFHRTSISFQTPALPENALPGHLFSSSCSSRSNLLESKTLIKCDFEVQSPKVELDLGPFFKEFGHFPSFGPLDQAGKKHQKLLPRTGHSGHTKIIHVTCVKSMIFRGSYISILGRQLGCLCYNWQYLEPLTTWLYQHILWLFMI